MALSARSSSGRRASIGMPAAFQRKRSASATRSQACRSAGQQAIEALAEQAGQRRGPARRRDRQDHVLALDDRAEIDRRVRRIVDGVDEQVARRRRGGDGPVDLGRRGRDHVPRAVEVGDLERPAVDRDRQRLDLRVDDGRDDGDVGFRVEQGLQLRGGDRAGADDEDALAGQAQERREQRRDGGRGATVGVVHARGSGRMSGASAAGVSGITCSPHSVFSLPRQRPARSSSPSFTWLVQVRQEMLG